MKGIHPVQAALRHVAKYHPEVTCVCFDRNGAWEYQTETGIKVELSQEIVLPILLVAAELAGGEKGWPCTYDLMALPSLYRRWDQLADVPVCSVDERVQADFEHFRSGTAREEIWRWFESQHPDFILAEVMAGIRHRTGDGSTEVDGTECDSQSVRTGSVTNDNCNWHALLVQITHANGWMMRHQSPHTAVEKMVETAVGLKQANLCWVSQGDGPPRIWARYDSEGRNVLESVWLHPLEQADEEQAKAEIHAMLQRIDAAIDGSYARALWLEHNYLAPDTTPKTQHC